MVSYVTSCLWGGVTSSSSVYEAIEKAPLSRTTTPAPSLHRRGNRLVINSPPV
ncbi:hypothetical protein [Odoribacter sp. AF15-53]|uniref:hypothetical protein n=1 Tax=Odoribacter sp. AF15-53 TaxID=2292236 RepID=UPI001314F0C4|nr:hypothetical protein [Odoribacter sp. AF15-53]